MAITVRPLVEGDIPTFLDLVQALADYEKIPGPDAAARDRLRHDALSDPPRFRVLLAELHGQVAGYSLYFFTYSSFMGRPTLYVEDIFVLPEFRRNGAGRALMGAMAREAVRNGCGRMEWTVLDWNKPAIALYEDLGGRILQEWRVVRVTAEKLARLAQG
jgi:GNAT superfamily N-acetyltransferase